MDELLKTQQKRAEALKELKSLLDKAEGEKRDLTTEEDEKYRSLETEVKDLEKRIAEEQKKLDLRKQRQEFVQTRQQALTTVETRINPPNVVVMPGGNNPESGFRNFGEFLNTIVINRFDPRLQAYGDPRQRLVEGRGQQMGVGSLGGFMVPDQFRNQILSITPQEAIVRPRATVMEAGDPPDGKLHLPSLDQTSSQNMYGGVIVYHQGEKSTLVESSVNLKDITFEPQKMTGYMTCTNDLLANWAAAASLCQTQMRMAIIGAEDYDFLRGSGVNRATGILNADCAIEVSRTTASSIVFTDISAMLARVKFGTPLTWVTSQTTIPQLAALVDAGNNAVFVKNAAENMPSTLMGFPVIYSERSPALGSTGDLMLCALSYYLIKDGSGPRIDVSTDFLFSTDKTCFRIVWHVDGHPWLTAPIPLEGSSGNTISPFVILK